MTGSRKHKFIVEYGATGLCWTARVEGMPGGCFAGDPLRALGRLLEELQWAEQVLRKLGKEKDQ